MFCNATAGQLNKQIPVCDALPQDGSVSNTVILPLFHLQQSTNNPDTNYRTSPMIYDWVRDLTVPMHLDLN